MTVQDQRYRSGPFVIKETIVEQPKCLMVEIDGAIFVPGWETRANAVHNAINVISNDKMYLDFQVSGAVPTALSDQIAKMKELKIDTCRLRESIDVEINRNLILGELRKWSVSGKNSIFIDITSLPKAYIQGLICAVFHEGLFAKVILGYAEGRYSLPAEVKKPYVEVDFSSANPMTGGLGPCREKRLVVVLGGERANCYAIIEKTGPDEILVLATKSDAHPEHKQGMETQIEKIRSVYSDRLIEVLEVDAFSMKSLLDAADPRRLNTSNDVAVSMFAGGTKPHAAACAILASSIGGIDLRYRRIREYEVNPVDWTGKYHLYDIVDLRSPSLPKCFPW